MHNHYLLPPPEYGPCSFTYSTMSISSSILSFLILSYALHPLSSTTTTTNTPPNRRILHRPFFPLDSQPPTPSPTTTNLPSPPDQSPFFPSYPPPPPPPPSPATFASFPANISSLVLPHSPKPKSSSQKLPALAISVVLSALIILAILLFYYYRRRSIHKHSKHSLPLNDISHTTNSNAHKLTRTTTTTTTNSDFLYLGTLVNSRALDRNSSTSNHSPDVSSGPPKLESPELRPLSPLNRQLSTHNYGNGEVGSTADDEEEEFYSPRGSLGGPESSIATGSGSRRTFAGGDFGARNSTSSSYTSSTSVSPARSQSLSMSPPISVSPRLKSPESSAVQTQRASFSLTPSHPPSPVPLDESKSSLRSFRSSSPDLEQKMQSSSLSSALASPTSSVEQGGVVSLQVLNGLDRNARSPSLSPTRIILLDQKVQSSSFYSVTSSPDGSLNKTSVASPIVQSDLVRNGSPSLSSASTSPSRVSEKSQSPEILDEFDGNMPSRLLFSTLTSPEISVEKNKVASPRISNFSDRSRRSPSVSLASTSPERGFGKSPDASPTLTPSVPALSTKISSVLEQPIAPTPPPPPPPPQRFGYIPITSTLTPTPTPTGQPLSKPPVLVPPSRPFVLQSTNVISPIEVPPISKAMENLEETPRPKLKTLHWDKVRASSDREMVWDQLRSSSFKLNEEMIESLFVVNTSNVKPQQVTSRIVVPSPNQENRVLDPKKAQNIAILLRALNVTIEEVCEALLEGDVGSLGSELLESLLKMAPSKEEERKLKEYKDASLIKLDHAEKFLKAVIDIPFAFKRVDAMLYIANFESEVEYLKKSFETLEAACEELRSSRMFLKLLEAVLKTGNRMNVGTNRGDAHAFKLDTLLKLADVKGTDGKTTLLHFVVQEIIRTEGARLSDSIQTPNSASSEDMKCRKLGLQIVSGLSSELTNVKKAAAMDSDVLSSDVSKLSKGLEKISEVVRLNETIGLDNSGQRFSESMNKFIKMAEEDIIRTQALESVALSLVKEITEYFHGNSAKEEAHPFRIFMVVRDFLNVLDNVCKEVGMINERTIVSSAHKFPVPVNPTLPKVFSVTNARNQYCPSDEENASS